MVCRVAQISVQRHGIELWIQHKEILSKQTTVAYETTALAGNVRAAVQEIRKLAHVAICNKRSRVRVRTKRCRSRNCRAVDGPRSEIEAHQHVVEQFCIATGPRRIECAEKIVVGNIDCV